MPQCKKSLSKSKSPRSVPCPTSRLKSCPILGHTVVVDFNGVRMPQAGRCLNLAFETPNRKWVSNAIGSDQLNRTRLLEQLVLRQIHFTHATGSDALPQSMNATMSKCVQISSAANRSAPERS